MNRDQAIRMIKLMSTNDMRNLYGYKGEAGRMILRFIAGEGFFERSTWSGFRSMECAGHRPYVFDIRLDVAECELHYSDGVHMITDEGIWLTSHTEGLVERAWLIPWGCVRSFLTHEFDE